MSTWTLLFAAACGPAAVPAPTSPPAAATAAPPTAPTAVAAANVEALDPHTVNELYRDPDKPHFHDVQIKGGGDATSAARAMFQTGDSDYSWNLQVEAQVLNRLSQGGKATKSIADQLHGPTGVATCNQWHGLNYHRWSNAEYDGIYAQLKTETEPAKRNALIIRANDLLISQLVTIPLVGLHRKLSSSPE